MAQTQTYLFSSAALLLMSVLKTHLRPLSQGMHSQAANLLRCPNRGQPRFTDLTLWLILLQSLGRRHANQGPQSGHSC